jgi:uncharacterized membrane protein YdjX (TVP38/TMEM64 family)
MPTPKRDFFTAGLALLWSVAFFAFLGALFVMEVPASNKDTMMLAAGILFGIVSGACGYYFGSSQGSAQKQATIDTLATNATPPEPPAV